MYGRKSIGDQTNAGMKSGLPGRRGGHQEGMNGKGEESCKVAKTFFGEVRLDSAGVMVKLKGGDMIAKVATGTLTTAKALRGSASGRPGAEARR